MADKDSKDKKLLHWTHTSNDVLESIDIDYLSETIEVLTEFIELNIKHLEDN